MSKRAKTIMGLKPGDMILLQKDRPAAYPPWFAKQHNIVGEQWTVVGEFVYWNCTKVQGQRHIRFRVNPHYVCPSSRLHEWEFDSTDWQLIKRLSEEEKIAWKL